MGTERKAIQTMDEWMGNQARLSRQQARRPQISTAAELLGGGFGPTATLLQDWNDDLATFNGFFYSVAGLSINSPDPTDGWAGIVISEADRESGVQEVWTAHSGTPPRRWTRRWTTPGGVRTYSTWVGDTEWQATGITVVADCTITEAKWRTAGRTVFIGCRVVLTTAFTGDATTGGLTNTALLQVPAEIVPVNGPTYGQSLSCGSAGPLVSYSVSPTGQILICATGPGVPLPIGQILDIAGTYSL